MGIFIGTDALSAWDLQRLSLGFLFGDLAARRDTVVGALRRLSKGTILFLCVGGLCIGLECQARSGLG